MIKALLGIDLILDILEPREEFYLDSFSVLNLCDLQKIEGWISGDSYSTIHYFLSKELDESTSRDKIVTSLKSLSVIPVRNSTLADAFESQHPDFEDNLKIVSAQKFHIDFIVTRNTSHYKNSPIEALTPQEFMNRYKSGKLVKEITSVPFLDLKSQHHQIYNEIDDRITDIIANTGFILGKHVDEFEERFAELQGAKHCIGVSSGTDALHIALLALGIGPGDAVIVPVNTFIATAEAVNLCGAEPVFVDCDRFYNLDVEKVREIVESRQYAVNSRQRVGEDRGRRSEVGDQRSEVRGQRSEVGDRRAEVGGQYAVNSRQGKGPITNNESPITCIIPVHLYGQPANMDEIMALAEEFGLMVVEDGCQAHLARYRKSDVRWQSVGTTGAFGAFSFYPGKNLGAYGEAGALVTNDEELYMKAKMIRQHGEIERYHHKVIGHNYRMEAIQGAVLATKLKYLDEWTKKRQENARLYNELLGGVDGIQTPEELEGTDCVYHLYIIQADDRDGLQKYLQEKGVASGLHYPIPLHLQEAYEYLGHKEGDFPVAEKAAGRILSLPMYPELMERQIRYVCDRVKEFLISPQRRRERRDI